MRSIASAAAFAGLASLAFASPIEKQEGSASTFTVKQVAGAKKFKNGPAEFAKALGKFGAKVPDHVAAAAAAVQSGSATSTPEAEDVEWLTPVKVGTTTLNLDFDTGSSDLWVFSSLLPANERAGHTVFTPNANTRLNGESFSIQFGDGSAAAGEVFATQVAIGAVTATSQVVEAATSVSASFTEDTQTSGLLGLAFSTLNTVTPNQATTFFDTVKSTLASPVFAADLVAGKPGAFDFGFIDTTKFTGTLDFTPVDDSEGFWMITTGGFAVGNTVSRTALTGIVDTGTTLLLVDNSVVNAYYAQVAGARNNNAAGGITFPCSATLPNFSLTIAGKQHTVPGSFINFAPIDNTGTTCFGGIQSDAGIGFSIFGDIFIKSQYVVFDQTQATPRIGFGQQVGVA